jgi:hypothetical protein
MNEIINAIKQLLETSVAQTGQPLDDILRVYNGDPIRVPNENLPCLIIKRGNTEYVMRGSRYDEKIHNVQIILLYNQSQFFSHNVGTLKTITDASWSANEATFTIVGHGYSVGEEVNIQNIDPTGYNGFHTITAKTDDTFTVAMTLDPGTYSSGGTASLTTDDIVHIEVDASKKVGNTTNKEVDQYTICGTIQNNLSLPYTASGTTTNQVDIARVVGVEYIGLTESRGWRAYEVVVNIEAKVIGDR